ncbi:MAG TPA: hypothetical protein VEJ87_06915 [Acidimicrobiales bacterium]|nr:hypothetical protein [Acidimicrobiales bacterium]
MPHSQISSCDTAHLSELARNEAPLVLVVGMHRSGTSATAGAIAAMGINPPRDDDLMVDPGASNEKGHWESRSLLEVNNLLIRHYGGTWSAPALPDPDWYRDPVFEGLRAEASRRFAQAFDKSPSVWKDPRLCLTLPFWTSVITLPVAAIFVFRDPMEVAISLQARSEIPITYGLASWDRHVRCAAANLSGIPTLAVDYGNLVTDPAGFADEVVDFFANLSLEVEVDARDRVTKFLDQDLRHQRDIAYDPHLLQTLGEVMDVLRSKAGQHHPWTSPELGSEPGWVDDVLSLAARSERALAEIDSFRSSPAYRFAQSIRKVHKKIVRR